ncbi:MAG: hypothetical protein OQL05_04690, partial [Gammaproteobacteria bacterium]|nr:hypothetical protein [Gammaproteobacteria bacterium]
MTAKSKKITMANTNAIKPLEIADIETLVQAREEYAMAVACVKKQREEEKKFAHKRFVQKLPDNYRPPLIGRFTKQHRHAFTRTKKTEVQYMKRARSLTKRFECDPAVNGRSDEDAFFMWILIRKQLIKTSTWKGDRSALLYFFSSTSYLHALILNTNNVGG